MSKNWSKYQLDIFSSYEKTNKNIVINATAGSGKTSTLLELLKRTPTYKSCIFLAFNKSIAEELKTKVPAHVKSSTLHSLGLSLLFKNIPFKIRTDDYKYFGIAKKYLDLKTMNPKKQNAYIYQILDLYNTYRINLCNDIKQLEEILRSDGDCISEKEGEHLKVLIKHAEDYNLSNSHKVFSVDYTDMLYLPILLKLNFPKFDVVFCDECQDFNRLQKKIIDNLPKPVIGRTIFVGDKNQAIYKFMGADIQVFRELETAKNTICLPLSVSYRCAKNIVNEAKTVFDEIECYDGNVDGEVVRNGNFDNVQDGDFVLCRNNKPLIELWLKLISQGKKASILGKEHEKALVKILDQLDDHVDVFIQFDEMMTKLHDKLKDKGISDPYKSPKYFDLLEKIAIIKILLGRYKNIHSVKKVISEMFVDNMDKGIILMTIHKSKGLEAENVYILMYDLIPSEYAVSLGDLHQEKCLAFVALTRAKKRLTFVDFI